MTNEQIKLHIGMPVKVIINSNQGVTNAPDGNYNGTIVKITKEIVDIQILELKREHGFYLSTRKSILNSGMFFETTNEQINCPVCGEEEYDPLRPSSGEFVIEGTIECENPVFVCHNRNCPLCGFEYNRDRYNGLNTLIQSRIDKEKAAAVQQERGRVTVIEERYNKILLAVQSKYEGEARWETALRYIKEREDKADDIGEELLP